MPFKGRPGRPLNGHVEPRRAVAYGASDVRDEISSAHAAGHEVAVHGIDAWHDAEAGRAEQRELAAAGAPATGVRMHWLYFGADSPRQLEAAGFEYDSTCGYNDAVGFRAGTSQAFKLEESAVMELPLAIMDSALFFPDRMGLSPADALRRCEAIVEHVWRFGGTVVVNWHDRSLAPERLWGRAYGALLDAIERHAPVWFATAREAVRWFAWRRSVTFAAHDDGRVTVRAPKRTTTLPAARVWVHDPARRTPQELLLDDGGELELAS